MNLIYGIGDKPKFKDLIVFSLQQLLAIIAATIVVPIIVNGGGVQNLELDPAAALFGAGVGTLVYVAFTQKKSPVFLGSSFAFLSSMMAATAFGYFGLIVGAIFAGLVYVVIALVIKATSANWINKLMPPVVIGPTVAVIGLSLAGSAVGDFMKASGNGQSYSLVAIAVAVFTLLVTVLVSTKSKGMGKLIPFIIGVLAGYALAAVLTFIGKATGNDALLILDFSALVNNFAPLSFSSFFRVPKFALVEAFKELSAGQVSFQFSQFVSILALYAPVALVVFAEHVADHKNISSIIGVDLLKEPGLDKTLLGDGVGSMVGALFGTCPNTTYGESIACVAVTKNASVSTIICTAIMAIILSFFSPFVAFVNTIPSCCFGAMCVILYGFIAVSGLKMIQTVDLGDDHNLFVVGTILITAIGGLYLDFGAITITSIATALILGIIVNIVLNK
ncbi:MAG: solute carrier family 23 protein [Erysipelotrichaceae bacterium]|nr:solute carrier family 23 protein [Erysipelotrichaceae bacterium]